MEEGITKIKTRWMIEFEYIVRNTQLMIQMRLIDHMISNDLSIKTMRTRG